MSTSRKRLVLAFFGACLMWGAIAFALLYVAAAIWLFTQGDRPSWAPIPIIIVGGLAGYGSIRVSRVPFGEAMNIGP